jgi:hypothetical protein
MMLASRVMARLTTRRPPVVVVEEEGSAASSSQRTPNQWQHGTSAARRGCRGGGVSEGRLDGEQRRLVAGVALLLGGWRQRLCGGGGEEQEREQDGVWPCECDAPDHIWQVLMCCRAGC